MPKKHAHQKQNVNHQEQDRIALNRMFNTFLIGLATECYLFIVYRGYVAGSVDSLLIWHSILRVLMWVGLGALIGGCGLALAKRSNKKLCIGGLIAAALGAFFSAGGWIMTNFLDNGRGVKTMCIIVPVLTVLMLIYFLYQRECFVSTSMVALALFTIWICEKGMGGLWNNGIMIGTIVVAVLLAAAALAVRMAQKNEGKLFGLQVFGPDCTYGVVYLVTAVCVILPLLALFVPGVTYYLIWAAVITLFAELAFFTTKMM